MSKWTQQRNAMWQVRITPDKWAIVGVVRVYGEPGDKVWIGKVYVVWVSHIKPMVTREIVLGASDTAYAALRGCSEEMERLVSEWFPKGEVKV